ncbi:hypothetical protein OC846_006028 [Tilletia horrida]|uniref:Uncharacterized protein n=1 Tax=Tilletia horrida TaxID=155126 RepID=A0AAN6JPP7_9BASI|nr:hypothetical protein OC845_006036 [Tilletia horrida]KAK0544564.1 hypothetical protein OC846_006028 [Tilletia horrida]KAK0560721.1 hypothetical protein OC861_006163 [Tilletia horrida]
MTDAEEERVALLPTSNGSTSAQEPLSWRERLGNAWHSTTKKLLPSHQQHELNDEDDLERRLRRKAVWQRRAHIAGVALFSIFLAIFVFGAIVLGHLFIITLRPLSSQEQSAIVNRALIVKGPDRLSLLNLTSDGALVQLDARLGLDPDEALDEWLGARGSRSPWQNLERRWLEWGFRQVKGIRIDVLGSVSFSEQDKSKDLPPKHLHLIDGKNQKKKHSHNGTEPHTLEERTETPESPPAELLGFDIEPLYVRIPPLRSGKSRKSSGEKEQTGDASSPTDRAQTNLSPLNLTLLLRPLVPIPDLVAIGEKVVKQKKATFDIHVPDVLVRGLGEKDMREGEKRKAQGQVPKESSRLRRGWGVAGWVNLRQGAATTRVTDHVPDVSLGNDTSSLLQLTHYDFFEIGSDPPKKAPAAPAGNSKQAGLAAVQDMVHSLASRALGIRADAVAKNPLGKLLHGHVRYQLPFGVYLPIQDDEVPLPPIDNSTAPSSSKAKKPMHGDPDDDTSVLMAVVATEPLTLTGAKKLSLKLEGRVVPPPPKSSSLKSSDESQLQQPFTSSASSDLVTVKETPQEKALSNFLSKFLRGDANTVYVRGGSPWSRGGNNASFDPTLPGNGSPDLPEWISSALGIVDLPISFPGSKVTDLIKDVTIENLKFTTHFFDQDKILCSGTVVGTLNLPKELGGVDVKVTELWPDILVFDGKPPSMRKPKHGDGHDGDHSGNDDDDDYYDDDDDDDHNNSNSGSFDATRPFPWEKLVSPSVLPRHFSFKSTFDSLLLNKADDGKDDPPKDPKKPAPEPEPPLPDPLPEGAFGRLRPHDFTPATTTPDPSDPSGARKILRCELVNVPFTVLPGRSKEFREFAWKIITGGATAGIEGSARARIWNSGLGILELNKLPVKGTFPVAPPS